MNSSEIRSRFLKFFENRGHTIVASAPLVPENDPTVLFNTAGMQPLVPYLMGKPHPQGKRLANFQKCVRTNDIEEIGDNTHATFFEMMGNWSLGDYFKTEAIEWSYELLTSKSEGFGLDPQRLYVTCFKGDENAEKDEESASIWKNCFEKNGVSGERIYFLGADANWWPAVKNGKDGWTGPTGPCTEMFYDVTGTLDKGMTQDEFLKNDEAQNVVEIWNDVFMEFQKEDGKITGKLSNKNVDTGSGFERIAMVLQGKKDIFSTDIFSPIMDKMDEFISPEYGGREGVLRSKRIIAEHIRSAVMLISDGVVPSNTDQGYILRRLIRRAVRKADSLGMKHGTLFWLADKVIDLYAPHYTNVGSQRETIKVAIDGEEQKFRKTLSQGLKEFEKMSVQSTQSESKTISGKDAFLLFSTYGFPIEITEEMAKEKDLTVDLQEFEVEMKKHQDLSRQGSGQKFKGGLGDTSDQSLKYHTATHLLHQALRTVLGDHVSQKGSNITVERLRLDFTHPQKMNDEEKKKVEDIVNEKIKENLPVQVVSLTKDEAVKTGALHFFGDKYGDVVTVYYIGDSVDAAFSKEFCGGPHVNNTGVLGTFKIQKEEAVSQGIRRIKATLS